MTRGDAADEPRRVVVTGMGAVTALGNDVAHDLGRASSPAGPACARSRPSTRRG